MNTNTLTKSLPRIALWIALFCFVPSAAFAQIVTSNFDTNADGWTLWVPHDSLSTLTYLATDGNPPGDLRLHDEGTGGNTDYFSAPAKFLGDDSAFYNGALTFDLWFSATTDLNNPNVIEFRGADGNTLGFNFNQVFASGDPWKSFSLTLNESSGWIFNPNASGIGSTPTQAQFQGVFSNVSALKIAGDWHSGPEDV